MVRSLVRGKVEKMNIENLLRGIFIYFLIALGIGGFFIGLCDFLLLSKGYANTFLTLLISFLVLSQWSITLPSGASFRPAVMLITLSMLVLPLTMTPLVATPGLLLIAARAKQTWWNYPLSVGHITAGLYAGGWVYHLFVPSLQLTSADLPWAIFALFVHLCINRIFSAYIVSYKKKRPFFNQVKMTVLELNWSYLNTYLMSIISALIYQKVGLFAYLLSLLFFWSIFKSVSYYSQMHKWQKAAQMDGLTGAENRASLEEFIKKMKVSPQTGTLAMIDLDSFKMLNDEHGHEKGDQVLQRFVNHLYLHLKDARIFRYGGDEFFLFISHTHEQGVRVRSSLYHLIQKIEHEWEKNGLPVRASVGCSQAIDGSNFGDLLAVCDEAMYKHKREKKAFNQ